MNGKNKLLVVGLARNVGKSLSSEISRIERITSEFYSGVDFYIVESDSIDNTEEVLMRLSSNKRNVSFESLGSLEKVIPGRIDRLRFCRNRYISAYREKSDKYSEIMIVDFDIRNTKFNVPSMKSVASFTQDWSGLFANQSGKYFDIFALRAKGWCTTDCFSEVDLLVATGKSREEAKELAIWGKMRRIKANSNPVIVDSAFGGMAIYRSWVFDQFDYSIDSIPIKESESEHISLNYKVKLAGGNLFIVPNFTNFGWNPHNLASFKTLRRLDRVTKRKKFLYLRSVLRSLIN